MNLTSKLKNTWKYTKDFLKPKNIILTTAITWAALTGTVKAQEVADYTIHGKITSGTSAKE